MQNARRSHALRYKATFAAHVELRLACSNRSLGLALAGVQVRSALVIRGSDPKYETTRPSRHPLSVSPGRTPNVLDHRGAKAEVRAPTGQNGVLRHNATLSDAKRTSVFCPGASDNAALCCPVCVQLRSIVQCAERAACGVPRGLWSHRHVRVAPGQRRAQVQTRTSLARCSKDVFLCALRTPPMFHGGACSGRKCSEEAEGLEGKVHEQQSKSQTQSLEEEV